MYRVCIEYAQSMYRVCTEYAQSMPMPPTTVINMLTAFFFLGGGGWLIGRRASPRIIQNPTPP